MTAPARQTFAPIGRRSGAATIKIHEDARQRIVIDWIKAVAPSLVPVAIPNAARRTDGDRAGNAVAGLLPGAPDIVVALPGGRVVWLEIKTPTGRLSGVQKTVHANLRGLGHEVHVVIDEADVRTVFKVLDVETREARAA